MGEFLHLHRGSVPIDGDIFLAYASHSLRERASSFSLPFPSFFSILFEAADEPPERDDDLLLNDHERLPLLAVPVIPGNMNNGNVTPGSIVGICVNVTSDAAAAAEEWGNAEGRLVTVLVREPVSV